MPAIKGWPKLNPYNVRNNPPSGEFKRGMLACLCGCSLKAKPATHFEINGAYGQDQTGRSTASTEWSLSLG